MKTTNLLLAVLVLLSLSCDGPSPPAGEARPVDAGGDEVPPSTIKVGMLPKLSGIPYFTACRRGAEEAARELGIDLVYDGPITADAVRQGEIVNAWILRGFQVIAVAPNNPEAIAPVLEKARARGIRVITWDTDALPAARELFVNQVSAAEMARALVEIVAEELGGKGRVALVSGTETAANQNTWMGFMRAYAKEKRPGIVFVDPVEYPGEDDARSYQSAMGLLRRTDRPDAIVGMTSVSAPAAAKAVFDAKMSGKVVVTGITLPSSMRPHLKSGTVKRFVLWNPGDLGYLAMHVAKRLADGKPVESPFDAGKLKGLQVKDGEVLLGPPLVFDASNIEAYDF